MKSSTKSYLGILGLIVVTIIWGGGFVVSDIALDTLTPFQILTGRFFIGTVLLFPLSVKSLKRISKAEIKAGIILGAFLFSGFALQTVGLQYTTLSKNAFLTATNVVIVPFIAFVIYKKKMSPQGVAGAIVAVIGAGVLSLNESFSLGVGDTLTLACAVCFAFQIFLTGEYVKRYSVMALNFFQIATAFVMSAVGLLCTKGTVNIQANTDGILAVVYLGVGSTTITYLLQTVSQRYVDETKSAVILSMEAVFGTIFSIILLHEMVTIKMIIGCALIFGAVLISEVKIKGKNDCLSVKMFTN